MLGKGHILKTNAKPHRAENSENRWSDEGRPLPHTGDLSAGLEKAAAYSGVKVIKVRPHDGWSVVC